MRSSRIFAERGLSLADAWRSRGRTLRAMLLLSAARLLVALVPLRWWRASLGQVSTGVGAENDAGLRDAIRLASHIERAAQRLPFQTKCLPRAMALAWMLRGAGLDYRVVIAIRPPDRRGEADGLHAWVACAGTIILGDLPGPWQELLALHRPAG